MGLILPERTHSENVLKLPNLLDIKFLPYNIMDSVSVLLRHNSHIRSMDPQINVRAMEREGHGPIKFMNLMKVGITNGYEDLFS